MPEWQAVRSLGTTLITYYRQYLCRDADPGGMYHHINLLASGQMALDQIRNGIANGAEAQQHKNGCR